MGGNRKRASSKKGKSPEKRPRRSAVLKNISLSEAYSDKAKWATTFQEDLKEKKPFPHWQLTNFVDNSNGIVEDIESELQEFPNWRRKENDLYSLYQTDDFKSLEIQDHPSLFALRQFLYGSVKDWLSAVSGVELLPQVDVNGSCYSHTDGLLPHNDLIDTRRFAFVYYLTPFKWDKENGGELNLYNADKNDQPTDVAVQLVPRRNSLLIFEVSHRSWHRVAEILGQEDPRLSVNGWFHSARRLEAKKPEATQLSRSAQTAQKQKLPSFISSVYLNPERKQQIQEAFGDLSESFLKEFLTKEVGKSVLAELKKTKFTQQGPPSKRVLYLADLEKCGSSSQKLAALLRSRSMAAYLGEVTGCELKDCKVSLNLSKIQHGCYTVLGDEDAEQAVKDGFSLEAHLFFGDSAWSDEAGGSMVYVGKDDEEELINISPEPGCLALVLRDPEVFSFLKFANSRAKGEIYHVALVYHGVPVEHDEEDEATGEEEEAVGEEEE